MIKRFNQYSLEKEIDYLFESSNESISDFKNRLLKLIPKIKKEIDLNNLISRFFKFIESKSFSFKKLAMSAFLMGFIFNTTYNIQDVDKMIMNNPDAKEVIMTDEEIEKALEQERINAMFKEYEKRASIYLSRDKWKDSPLNGKMFSEGAKKAYIKHGVFIPVELALAQAQFESHFGTTGRSAKNNPFNVGEYDSHTQIEFNSPQEGINMYYDVMANDYLKNKTVDDLLDNFVNNNGHRYASNKDYEKVLKNQISYNKKWIDKNIKSKKTFN